ncbi:MAG TPA: hypothetical protein VK364_07785 [Hymenobacter sp.]|nr:hypothetical protein [Hymenobacter sp.]HLL93485.1 hypothetical protein [Spirosoma sp.]
MPITNTGPDDQAIWYHNPTFGLRNRLTQIAQAEAVLEFCQHHHWPRPLPASHTSSRHQMQLSGELPQALVR